MSDSSIVFARNDWPTNKSIFISTVIAKVLATTEKATSGNLPTRFHGWLCGPAIVLIAIAGTLPTRPVQAATSSPPEHPAEDMLLYNHILEDWKVRENGSPTVDLSWETFANGADPGERRGHTRLVLSQGQSRIERTTPTLDQHLIIQTDIDSRGLFTTYGGRGQGFIDSQPKYTRHFEYVAPFLVYRGTRPDVTDILAARWQIEPDLLKIDGVACTGLALLSELTNSRSIYWVDLACQSLPLRYESVANQEVRVRIDISYNKSDGDATISGWTSTWETHVTATNILLKRGEQVPPTEFALNFPEGTPVVDINLNRSLVSNGDGTFRPWVPTKPKQNAVPLYAFFGALRTHFLRAVGGTIAIVVLVVLGVRLAYPTPRTTVQVSRRDDGS